MDFISANSNISKGLVAIRNIYILCHEKHFECLALLSFVTNITLIINSLKPKLVQIIAWRRSAAEILLIGRLGTNFNDILFEIHKFSLKKMHLKMSSATCRLFCLGLNVLITVCNYIKGIICLYTYFYIYVYYCVCVFACQCAWARE